ncbi:SAM-dependent methyltransferase [Legionella sp. MW5194]|uniref:class I SAM-dependent methyltransferase n=1 Tax=Legionella sp. MW5194 TaxID=2662448 RepID=UPI00193CCDB5|nr:SAM-dependent methyltransferase [Legionella sp. MW5194]QRN04893.1 SAM-dependent methyltransferase [Legionella sp. MW5194]
MSNLTSLHPILQACGEIPFVEFMQHALYAPGSGYYSAGLQKFGAEGDFITAPELTPLFAQTLAVQCQQILKELDRPVLFEFGAGSGRLCVDLLKALEALQCLPEQYLIMEVSGNLRQRQHQLIQTELPHLQTHVQWLERWPEQGFDGVMIANEVLDAMPVHRFLQTEQGLLESWISVDEQGQLSERFKPCDNSRLINYLQQALPDLPCPYQSEVNLFTEDWLKECSRILHRGAMLLIDYGFPRHEYYHPDRNQGTLMCHFRHHAHSNPLIHVGEQDITAHVDFTQVAEAGHDAGFHVAGYTNQASFLLANGLLSLLERIADGPQRIRAQQAVKQLIQPEEMGELFKVIALTKGIDFPLQGFLLHDKRVSL